MKKTLIAAASIAFLAAAGAVLAQDACPVNETVNDVEARPLAFRTFGDAYGIANAHYLWGTSDPFGPPFTIEHPACTPDGNTVGFAGYVGSVGPGAFGPGAQAQYSRDMVAVFVFDASEIEGSASKHALRFRNVQNFTGSAFQLNVKILENRGDVQGSPGARGIFNRLPVAPPSNNRTANGALGPFGAPGPGVLSTVVADARSDRGNAIVGSCTLPALGKAGGNPGLHDSGGGQVNITFDRDADIPLIPGREDNANNGFDAVRGAIKQAQRSDVEYKVCRYSCVAPALVRNVDCGNGDGTGDGITVRHPLYVGVTAVFGGSADASTRLQDSITVDNLVHLMGDSDFAGEDGGPGTQTRVAFVSKFN